MYSNHQEILQGKATSAVSAFTILAKDTANDGQVIPAIVTGSVTLVGVAPNYAVAAGTMCPITVGGVAQVQLGGSVANGDILTNDTNGYAIKSTNYSSNKYNTIGTANRSGATGDIIPVIVVPQNYAW